METCECQVGNRQGPVERNRGEALCILCYRSHSQLLISMEAWALDRPFKQAQVEFQSISQLVPVPGLRHISGKLAAQCPLITWSLALPTLGRRKASSELSRPRAVFPLWLFRVSRQVLGKEGKCSKSFQHILVQVPRHNLLLHWKNNTRH